MVARLWQTSVSGVQADSANAAVRNVGKKNNPDEARDRMIQRHAGEKED